MMSIFDDERFNERLFFARPDRTPAPAGAEDLWCDVDGARLHVRLHGGRGALLLLFHGNGEIVADYDDMASLYADAGARLAVCDFRGYGKSTGSPTLRRIVADAPAVLDAVCARVGGKVIVMGRSLGSACATEASAARPEKVAGLVLESGFVSLERLIARRGLEPPGALPEADRATFDPLPKLRRITAPLLVLHGDADQIIAIDEAERAHEAGAGPKTFARVGGRGHNDLQFAPSYWQALSSYIASLDAPLAR